jgi:acetyl esterase
VQQTIFWILRFGIALAVLTALPAVAHKAFAQNLPPAAKERLVKQKWSFAPDDRQMFDKALSAAPKTGVKVTRDLAYGKHAAQKLDIYQPDGASNLPIMVYVFGGAYSMPGRNLNDHLHANVLQYFAHNGFVGVNADYRLAPEFKWPSGGEDVASIVQWIKQNAAKFGGDPQRIYLFGHSSGASHVGLYAFDRRVQPSDGPGIAGVILLGGRYAVYADPDDPTLRGGITDYFGNDPAQMQSRSVTSHVGESNVPAMIVMAEFEKLNLAATSGELFTALCKRDGGRCPRFVQLKYHNHLSEAFHFNSGDDYLGKEIIEWVNEGFGQTRGVGP